jgi:hypothetical protein
MGAQLSKTLLRFTLLTVLTVILAGLAVPAHAVTVGLDGIVTAVDGVNPYGIIAGSLVTGSVSFDALAAPLNGVLSFLDDPTMAMDFTVGEPPLPFSFSTAAPFAEIFNLELGFTDGMLQAIDLLAVPNAENWILAIGFDDSLGINTFLMLDLLESTNVVVGTVSAVPVPATLMLVLTGLLGSAGILRRSTERA